MPIAYALNGNTRDAVHGALLSAQGGTPTWLQHAKYVERAKITDSFSRIAGGRVTGRSWL
jgi:hypothetical protein